MSDGPTSDAGSDAGDHELPAERDAARAEPDPEPNDSAATPERTGRKRRRRRGRGRHGANAPAAAGEEAHTDEPSAAASSPPPPPSPPPPDPGSLGKAFATLTAGLFSHIDDRQVPCKMDGCDRTWTWSAVEQIQAFGQPPPRRMCAEHYAQHHAQLQGAVDREVQCSNPWCERTWVWPKNAQLALLQRSPRASAADLEPPARTCEPCARQDRELADSEVPCRVDGCKRTWTWSRDAQLKHRAWLRHSPHQVANATVGTNQEGHEPRSEGPGDERRGRRRRRRRGAKSPDDPPPRMCEPCRQRLNTLVDRESTCKVHGCTRTVTIDRESQLRAWAATAARDLDADVPLAKRMCEVCREFCRLHPDREVACGRPGCDRTWTYKTGAQLQAFLAGRFEDPLRLCESCMSGMAQDGAAAGAGNEAELNAPEGAELMPCVVTGCDGIWHWLPGMHVGPANDGDQPIDRMCARHRAEHGQASDVHGHEGDLDDAIDEVEAAADEPSVEHATTTEP